ncbi:MAG: hypothetical protein AAGD38_03615 [Acidobacteriota bacterium]
MNERDRAVENLNAKRRDAERRLESLRDSIEREVGWVPAMRTWGPALVALAFGAAVALGAKALISRPPRLDE